MASDQLEKSPNEVAKHQATPHGIRAPMGTDGLPIVYTTYISVVRETEHSLSPGKKTSIYLVFASAMISIIYWLLCATQHFHKYRNSYNINTSSDKAFTTFMPRYLDNCRPARPMTSLEITSVKITCPEKPHVRDYLSREIAIQDRLPVKTVHKYICAEDGNKEDIYFQCTFSFPSLTVF